MIYVISYVKKEEEVSNNIKSTRANTEKKTIDNFVNKQVKTDIKYRCLKYNINYL